MTDLHELTQSSRINLPTPEILYAENVATSPSAALRRSAFLLLGGLWLIIFRTSLFSPPVGHLLSAHQVLLEETSSKALITDRPLDEGPMH